MMPALGLFERHDNHGYQQRDGRHTAHERESSSEHPESHGEYWPALEIELKIMYVQAVRSDVHQLDFLIVDSAVQNGTSSNVLVSEPSRHVT
jgi:hypothetical protein